ncbi:MAG: hypothetical protein Q4G03_09310 [Planctomycetia bacterium]|nr:hypothetical protein [Planctomycetia bacterium]
MKHSIIFGLGVALLSLGLAGGGYLIGMRESSEQSYHKASEVLPVFASASSQGDGVVLATGSFSNNVEAMYYLDSQSGRLSAALISRTAPVFQKTYTRNLKNDLVEATQNLQIPMPASPRFLMVTGEADVRNVGAVSNLSRAFVYVAEINSGVVLVYALPGTNDRDLLVTDGEITLWTFARLNDGLQVGSVSAQPAVERESSDPRLIDSGFYRTR